MAEVSNVSGGKVLEKTTRTRIITESQAPDYWNYIEQQNLPDSDHVLYLYLNRDNRCIPYGRYTSHFQTRDGRLVPINDREAFEQALQARFGGGIWRLILKCGKQRKCEARVHTGDEPTLPPPVDGAAEAIGGIPTLTLQGASSNNPFTQHLVQPSAYGAAQIAEKAIDTIAGQESKAVNLGLDMMSKAADVVQRFANQPPQTANGPADELQRALSAAVIARLAQDPMAQIAQFFTFMREMNSNLGGAAGGSDITRQME